jgi:hypothetical protein
LVVGPGAAPKPSLIFGLAATIAVLALWAALLLLRGMETVRDRYVRRVMREAGVSHEDIEAVVPREQGMPWWRVELSGLHLALWVGPPVVVFAFGTQSEPPGWAVVAAIYIVFAWILKGGFWLGLLVVHPDRRVAWRNRYRWFGTLKGTLLGLIAVPGIVFGFVVLLVLLAELFGGL